MKYVDLEVPSYKDEKKEKKKKIVKFTIAAILLSIVLYGGYLFYWPISQLIKEIINNPGIVFSLIKDPLGDLDSTDGRTNILLLGIDKREGTPFSYKDQEGITHKNGFLTDTIIVLSVGKETKDAVMISIPRDIWVEIPGWGDYLDSAGKINSVYSVGNIQDYPGGGLELAKKVVSKNLGIPIHYATRIDFGGFRNTINTLEGIEVKVDKTFDDYNYPVEGKENAVCSDGSFSCRYKRIHFDAGLQKMDGETALVYVRSRKGTNGEGNDFARSARQQKVLVAVRKKALSLSNLLEPNKVNNLFKDFGESVETDFSLNLYPAALQLFKGVDTSAIKNLVLDNTKDGYLYSPNPAQYGGAYVLLPKGENWEKIQKKIHSFLFPPKENSE